MIEHRVDVDDPASHTFHVTLTIPGPAEGQVVSLPVWIPGSYLVREFARHVLSLRARQGRRECAVQALDKGSWRIDSRRGAPLVLTMQVHARDASVRTAWLDSLRGFFNGTSLCLRVQGRTEEAQALVIGRLPAGWEVATAMRPAGADALDAQGRGRYLADDYDELVDHPFELGRFWSGRFTARGVPHRLVVTGAWPDFDGDRLLEETRRICEAAIEFWHPAAPTRPGGPRRRGARPPFDRYLFLLNAVDDGYGGLEHRASTALIAARRDLPRRGAEPERSDGHVTLLGLISHEYFHAWNVKRLRPRELDPIDYSRENPTRLLWFFEGFTSYYDDLLLVRAGLIDAPRYLKLLGRTVSGVLGTPGRHLQSVAQASFDAWIKYYRPDENSPNATISYYAKGSLVALAMDLALRRRGASLDGAMRRLWQVGQAGPIDEVAIAEALQAEWLSGRDPASASARPARRRSASDAAQAAIFEPAVAPAAAAATVRGWLDQWVHGTEDLPLRELLHELAVRWTETPASVAQRLGVRASESGGSVRFTHVLAGSVARAAGIAPGDECVGVEGWRLTRLDDLPRLLAADGSARLLLARDQRLIELRLPALPPATPRPAAAAPHPHRHRAGPAGASVAAAIGASVLLTLPAPLGEAAAPADPPVARRRQWLGA